MLGLLYIDNPPIISFFVSPFTGTSLFNIILILESDIIPNSFNFFKCIVNGCIVSTSRDCTVNIWFEYV